MQRKQFLKGLGAGAAFAVAFPCLHACSKDEGSEVEGDGDAVVPSGVDFTVDLESQEAQNLGENGGFIVMDSIVIVKNLEGQYVAASQVCSHEGYAQVQFVDRNGGIFSCDVHGSRFEQNGTPLNKVGDEPAKSLKVFQTELSGTMLRVFE